VLKVVGDRIKGDRRQNSSAGENSNVTSGMGVQPGVSKTYVCSMLLISISLLVAAAAMTIRCIKCNAFHRSRTRRGANL
jgi:hypothetical protein